MNVSEPIRAWARKTPDAPAVLTEEGTLSFAELDRAVSSTATRFQEAGMSVGDAVGVSLPNSLQHLIAILSLARLGVGHVAFYETDPPELKRHIAKRINMIACIGDESNMNGAWVPFVPPPPGKLDEIQWLKGVDFEPIGGTGLPFLYMRSSGTTTGVPKLGLLTHEIAHYRLEHPRAMPSGPGTRYHSMININFTGAKYRKLGCLAFGGCIVLLDHISRAADYAAFVSQHHINYIFCTPFHVGWLLKHTGREPGHLFPDVDVLRIHTAFVGENLRREIQERLCENLFISYGTIEAGTISITTPEQIRTISGSVGSAMPGVKIEIDDNDGQPMPAGEIGRIRVKSPAVIDGYFNDQDETARVFRDGWFYTGDLVEVTTNGVLVHYGRADDMMILDGINIYPAEIENVLLRHPAVAEAAVFPIKSEARGDIPVAAITTKSQVSRDAVMAFCRSKLGTHAPHAVVVVDRFPRNAAGKVLKKELASQFERLLQQRKNN